MSDIPTKTYPPDCLHAMIADHEAEQAGATPEESSAVETKGDAMSDITRWKVSGPATRLQPDATGPWVALVDYYRAIDRLIAERDAAQAEVERLKEQVGALTLAVEQADEMKAHAEAAAAAEEAETDRVMSERDAAQAEVARLRANPSASLTSSRPTDEDIWREAFVAAIQGARIYDRMTLADVALGEYRKRWPR